MALWRNWIAHLTTNQKVTGSNLVRVTILQRNNLFIRWLRFFMRLISPYSSRNIRKMDTFLHLNEQYPLKKVRWIS